MRFFRRHEPSPTEPLTDEQIQILGETIANVSSALTQAPEKVRRQFTESQEALRQARFAGQLAADEVAKVYFN